jgi:hypothetical protein
MYIKQEEVDTMHELTAFVEGQLDAVEDEKYWFDFLHRVKAITDKMTKAQEKQNFRNLVNKEVRRLKKERK